MSAPYPLLAAWGIEIESMLVDAETLDVRPLADELLRAAAGGEEWAEDVDDGPIGWSNELVAHVIELKTNGPVASLEGVARDFEESGRRIDALLAPLGARRLPGAMHPWMDPARETTLWRHGHGEVYRAFDRLFDCRRHGWANLQAVHLNLSFGDDGELARLMAAVRLVLPLVPALAAASPVIEGRAAGRLDERLHVYRTNSRRVPAMTGEVIPEPVYDREAYRREVLAPIDAALGELGADEALRGGHEWTNARGAIVRFDRMAVEVRLIDAQEGPRADLAVAAAVGSLVRALVEERWAPHARQRDWPGAPLTELLVRAIDDGPAAPLGDRRYAALFGHPRAETAGELLQQALEPAWAGPAELEPSLEVILGRGTLAERLLAALGPDVDRARLRAVWGELAACLVEGRPFLP